MVSGSTHSRHDRRSVVTTALRLLDDHGLPELTMRRLAAALEVQPSALYHHFPNKQQLLAAVSGRILSAARPPADPALDWRAATEWECSAVRDALLAYRDGAELVLSTRALGLGGEEAAVRIEDALSRAHPPAVAAVAAAALLHLVFGDAALVQQRLQAESLGVELPPARDGAVVPGSDADFLAGVRLVLDGVEHADAPIPSSTILERRPRPTTV